MKTKRGILFLLFTFVLFITPNLPMPTSIFGPIGPALYVLLVLSILFIEKDFNHIIFRNSYFKFSLIFTIILILSDTLKILSFGFTAEIKYLLVRILNFGIFFAYGQYLIVKNKEEGFFDISPYYFKVYVYSIYFVAFILYGQAVGLITFGEVFPARTYFGLQLPFNKPVGLAELSDGKLGIMIAPIIYLGFLSGLNKYSFFKIKWGYFIAFILLALLVIMQSRSGYLGFAIGLVIFVIMYPSRKMKYYFFGSGALIFSLMYISGALSFVLGGLVGEGIYEKNVSARGNVLQYAFDKFLESPLYGVGHKDLVLFKDPFADHGAGSHNLFADHLGSGGLIAFIPFMGIFALFFYYAIKNYRLALINNQKKMIGFSCWLVTSMTYVMVELFFYRGFYNEYLYFFLALGTIPFLNYKILSKTSLTRL